jgi:epoxyqueuosine reductase
VSEAKIKPFQFSDSYQRFNQKNNLYCRMFWDPSRSHILPQRGKTQLKQIEKGTTGYSLKDYALGASAAVTATTLGTQINLHNSGLTSWEPLPRFGFCRLPESPAKVEDAAVLTKQVKRAARYFGADMVGIARLDRRWVYSDHYNEKTDESEPVEIDEGYPYVISVAVQMDYRMIATAPAALHLAESLMSYSKMAFLVAALAQYIRFLGYRAIPSLNDTGLNIPIAISAGLGQQGRLGILISPRFGPRVRLCKVITDLPLEIDHPIDFGVTEFCSNCQKCIKACPSGAIPAGCRTAEGYGISNNPGVMKWQLDSEKCDEFQASKMGTNCTICMRVCPFNKESTWVYNLSRRFVKRVPSLTRPVVWLDDLLGYGKRLDSELFWEGKI